jgi:hypothetical protein
MMADYLREVGLTPHQIDYMMRTAQPGIQLATEADASALGFHVQIVLNLFGSLAKLRGAFLSGEALTSKGTVPNTIID